MDTELLINNDSRSDLQTWLDELKKSKYDGNVFVSMSPNIHEIRGYNRLSKFTTATYLAHLQVGAAKTDDLSARCPCFALWFQDTACHSLCMAALWDDRTTTAACDR